MKFEINRMNPLAVVVILVLISVTAGFAQDSSVGASGAELHVTDGAAREKEPTNAPAVDRTVHLRARSLDNPFIKKPDLEVPERDLKLAPEEYEDDEDPSLKPEEEKFHWRPAIRQSMDFLGIQHGARMLQVKTTRQLEGPFFKDWGRAVRNLRGWRDGDNTVINYVAHPLQGGLTGRIFVNNSDNASRQEFGLSKGYWKSRAKAFVWSAAWSTQIEIGPLSEASIGNVGFPRKDGSRSTGYVDYVITPTVGTGVLVGEDAIDKYVLKGWIERKAGGRATAKVKLLRSLLTPTTSFANILRGKYPWKRYDR